MSELYALPNGWEWKKLGDIAKLQNGFAFKSNLFVNDGLPIVRIKNIKNEKVLLDDVVYFNLEDYNKKLDLYQIKRNDLLIAMSGATTGKIGLYETDKISYLNQRVGLFRIKNTDLRSYLFYFLSTQIEKNLELSLGAAQPNLSTEQINNIELPLPPLAEQQRIVLKLDNLFASIDKAIALHQKNIDEANVFMGSVLNDVFGELEENFKSKTLKEISNIISGYAFKSTDFSNKNEIKSIKITNVGVQNFVEEDENLLPSKLLTKLSKYTVKYGDIVIALTRPYISNGLKVTFVPKSYDGAFVNQRVAAIQSREALTTNNYIYHYLCTTNVLTNVMELSKTLNQPNLSIKDLSDFGIPLPPLQIQQKVVSYLNEISEKLEILKRVQNEKMESLKALKASILDQAFRGEL